MTVISFRRRRQVVKSHKPFGVKTGTGRRVHDTRVIQEAKPLTADTVVYGTQ